MKLDIQRFGGRGARFKNTRANINTQKFGELQPTKTNIHNKGVDNMINKYGNIIDEIHKDAEPYEFGGGYWVFLRKGYYSPDMESQTIHEASVSDVMKYLKGVRKLTEEEKRLYRME